MWAFFWWTRQVYFYIQLEHRQWIHNPVGDAIDSCLTFTILLLHIKFHSNCHIFCLIEWLSCEQCILKEQLRVERFWNIWNLPFRNTWYVNLEAIKNCSFYSFYRRSMKYLQRSCPYTWIILFWFACAKQKPQEYQRYTFVTTNLRIQSDIVKK